MHGNRAERDIVQFVPFRKFRNNYEDYAYELLAEIAPQIRNYFEAKKITPNDEILATKYRVFEMKDHDELDHNHEDKVEDYVDAHINKQKGELRDHMISCGFDAKDVNRFIEEGLHTREKFILFEKLNRVKYLNSLIPKQV